MMEFGNFHPGAKSTILRLYSAQKVNSVVTVMNTCVMPNRITHTTTLNAIGSVVYAAAITAARMLRFKVRTRN